MRLWSMLKPTFDLCKFPTLTAGQAVFKAMLGAIRRHAELPCRPKLTFINGQGTIGAQTALQTNLHPAKSRL